MTNKTFYNEILIDHNMHPGHKHDLDDANMVMEGLNPTCGDHIWLKLKVEDGVIVDGSFVGEGCAVSQASADMMLDLIIGQKVEEAQKLADNFLKMIKGTATEEEIESLEEASAHIGHFGTPPLLLRASMARGYLAASLAGAVLRAASAASRPLCLARQYSG